MSKRGKGSTGERRKRDGTGHFLRRKETKVGNGEGSWADEVSLF